MLNQDLLESMYWGCPELCFLLSEAGKFIVFLLNEALANYPVT